MDAYQSKKVELQGQKKELDKQVNDLSKRIESLKVDLAKTGAEVDRQSQVVTDALIAGTDHTKAQDQLQREKSNLESLTGTITQAGKRIKDLKSQADQIEKQSAALDFFRVADDVHDLVAACIKQLHIVIEDFSTIQALYIELTNLAAPSGLQVEYVDSTATTQRIYMELSQYLERETGKLAASLKSMEEGYKDFFKQTRNK